MSGPAGRGDRRREAARVPGGCGAAGRGRDRRGLAFVDPEQAALVTTIELDGGAHGLAMVTGLDNPSCSRPQGRRTHRIRRHRGRRRRGRRRPTDKGQGWGSSRFQDPARGLTTARRARWSTSWIWHRADITAGPWTVTWSSRTATRSTPRRLPDGFVPSAWGADLTRTSRTKTARTPSCSTARGRRAAIHTGPQPPPGGSGGHRGHVDRGAAHLLTRTLSAPADCRAGRTVRHRRRDVLRPVADRMNDVYVRLFIVAAYTVFAAIWTGWWKGRAASGS